MARRDRPDLALGAGTRFGRIRNGYGGILLHAFFTLPLYFWTPDTLFTILIIYVIIIRDDEMRYDYDQHLGSVATYAHRPCHRLDREPLRMGARVVCMKSESPKISDSVHCSGGGPKFE